MEQEPREPCLSSLCTIITTTSPTPVNPSTELICSTLDSLAENAPDLPLGQLDPNPESSNLLPSSCTYTDLYA